MVDHSIKGKTVFVTGGVKNLGGLIARDLAAHGAKATVIHYNSAASKAGADATVAALQAAGAKTVALQGDLTSTATMEKLPTNAIATMGKPDIAIDTVDEVLEKPFTEISGVEYDEMSAVSAKFTFFFLREVGKHINDNDEICTLATSLLGAYTPYRVTYTDAKAPVKLFIRAVSKEFDARGISATAIGPGPMNAPFFYPAEGADTVAYHKTAAALPPFPRAGLIDIEDVVPFIYRLISEGWWITNQTVLINGGCTAK